MCSIFQQMHIGFHLKSVFCRIRLCHFIKGKQTKNNTTPSAYHILHSDYEHRKFIGGFGCVIKKNMQVLAGCDCPFSFWFHNH